MKGLGVLALAVGLAASAPPTAAQEIPVDLELVLAVDVSGSVDEREYSLQMIGISEALRLPEVGGVVAARHDGAGRRPEGGELIAAHQDGVALTLVHWSAAHVNRQVVPWRLLRNGADASAFA